MFARTPRLTLRPGWPEDAPALAAAIGHEAVVSKLSHAPWPYREEDARAFLALPAPAVGVRLLVCAHEGAGEPRLVGCVGLQGDGDVAEFGYWLTPSAWGRGYATEAGRAVIALARHALPLRRLTSGWHVDNPASGRVLAKLGFRRTGAVWHASLARGRDVETVEVELVLDEPASDAAPPAAAEAPPCPCVPA